MGTNTHKRHQSNILFALATATALLFTWCIQSPNPYEVAPGEVSADRDSATGIQGEAFIPVQFHAEGWQVSYSIEPPTP